MLEVSKGDIVFEPLELVFDFIAKAFVRIFARLELNGPVSEWGSYEWIIVFIMTVIFVIAVWLTVRRLRRNRNNNNV